MLRKVSKSISLIIFSLFGMSVAQAQNVNIPDAKFKAYLLGNSAINTDSDSTEISVAEAQAFTGKINVSSKFITDLTGIESFTNITVLDCQYNQLTSLDVSQNTALDSLICHRNQITSLDVSKNTILKYLRCDHNQLSLLDVSKNTALVHLDCFGNSFTGLDVSKNLALQILSCSRGQLTTLDVSKNIALVELDCSSNPLTILNVANGNNQNFSLFWAYNNPNLTCIKVDDASYSNTNWILAGDGPFSFDSGVNFSENCSLSVETIAENTVSVYPNPATTTLNIEVKENTIIKIVNVLGVTVSTQTLTTGANKIDVSNFTTGVYFVRSGNSIVKFIKE